MQCLERAQEKFEFFQKAKAGNVGAILKASLMRGMISQDQYDDFLSINDEEVNEEE